MLCFILLNHRQYLQVHLIVKNERCTLYSQNKAKNKIQKERKVNLMIGKQESAA